MIKRYVSILLILIFIIQYTFAQYDSIVINVKGIDIVMIKISGSTFSHVNYFGDTIRDNELSPIDSLNKNNGSSYFTVDDYFIGKYEVDQELYSSLLMQNPSYYKKKKHPVNNVSWYDAMAFIDTLNSLTNMTFRLPTEAEWEYAASGNNWDNKYSGSNILDDIGWYWDNAQQHTHKVGTKLPNAFGLYDMSGNVSEWCQDWFSSDYYQKDKVYTNPLGPMEGKYKIIKGGSWGITTKRFAQYRTRVGSRPKNRSGGKGFRLAMDAK